MDKFTITTTNNIEGCPVREYLDAISTNIVIGANFLSDFAASLTDFFGGASGTYRKKLAMIYANAKRQLMEQAKALGANAIIGFTVDFDEISGKGKAMLMVSATGTACIIEGNPAKGTSGLRGRHIDKDTLQTEIQRRRLAERLEKTHVLYVKDRAFLLEHPSPRLSATLLSLYASKEAEDPRQKYAYGHAADFNLMLKEDREFLERYVQLFPREQTLDKVYALCREDGQYVELIRKASLFDPRRIDALEDTDTIVSLLDADKPDYTKGDVPQMQILCERLGNLPDKRRTVEKKGMFGKSKRMYVCPEGHEYETDLDCCPKCGKDKQGLTAAQRATIEKFKEKTAVLSALFATGNTPENQ